MPDVHSTTAHFYLVRNRVKLPQNTFIHSIQSTSFIRFHGRIDFPPRKWKSIHSHLKGNIFFIWISFTPPRSWMLVFPFQIFKRCKKMHNMKELFFLAGFLCSVQGWFFPILKMKLFHRSKSTITWLAIFHLNHLNTFSSLFKMIYNFWVTDLLMIYSYAQMDA